MSEPRKEKLDDPIMDLLDVGGYNIESPHVDMWLIKLAFSDKDGCEIPVWEPKQ